MPHSTAFFLPPGRVLLLLAALAAFGCAGPREAEEGETPRRARRARVAEPTPGFVAPDVAPPRPEVRTIQLFRTGAETDLPVVELGSGETLTLAFDLLADSGRPLTAYFYHADRRWRRDLLPNEYLDSFHRDELLDYNLSRSTQVPYVHYEYRFPNDNIRFRMSGNYVVRVVENGNEEEILFERPFFVTEQGAPVGMGVRSLMVGGLGWSFSQPTALVTPASGPGENVFDYRVCFARNNRFDLTRCTESPSLITMPQLQFYLEPEDSFEPETGLRGLDLSTIRIGNQIVASRLDRSPYEVVLETDFSNLIRPTPADFLGGQPSVRTAVRDVADPDLSAEYVRVLFRYVPPDERPLPDPVVVVGSFNGWLLDPANRLEWVEAEGRYEGGLLIKQGMYEYRYFTPGEPSLEDRRRLLPSSESLYTALVYYYDARINTDRLIAVENHRAP